MMTMTIDHGSSVVRAATIATGTVLFAAVGITMIVLSYLQWPNVASGIVTLTLVSIALCLVRHLSRNKKHMSHNREGSSTTTAAPFAHVLDASFRQQTLPTSPFLLYEAPVVLAPVLPPSPPLPPPLMPPTTNLVAGRNNDDDDNRRSGDRPGNHIMSLT
jgi:hypothetical protein